MSVFFIGIDPGITNIGVCVVGGEPLRLYVHDVFSIKRAGATRIPEDIYEHPNFYIQEVKSKLQQHVFSQLAPYSCNAQAFAILEEQYKCPYAVITGWLLSALADAGIQTQVHSCRSVRTGLGIPAGGRSPILKKNVLAYCKATGLLNTANDHIGDAFTLAMYCRQVVSKQSSKLPPELTPVWCSSSKKNVSGSSSTPAKKKEVKKKNSSEAAKRKRKKTASEKTRLVSKRQKKATSHGS